MGQLCGEVLQDQHERRDRGNNAPPWQASTQVDVGEQAENANRTDATAVAGVYAEVIETLSDPQEDKSENKPHLIGAKTEEELEPVDVANKQEDADMRPKLFGIKSIVE